MIATSVPWKNLSFIAFDTETTGKYPVDAEICEIAAVKWENGAETGSFETLIRPHGLMSDEVIGIHHITNEMVVDAPLISEKITEFYDFVAGSICIAHHAPFDLGFVTPEFEKMNLKLPDLPAICTSLISRKVIPESANHRLQTLVKLLNIDGGQAHRALDDARACLHVALECFQRIGSEATLQELLDVQSKPLLWQDYSLDELKEKSRFNYLIRAITEKGDVQITYDGGSRPGKPRRVQPLGIVRNPDGDFLVGIESGQDKTKRYYLKKISSVKIC